MNLSQQLFSVNIATRNRKDELIRAIDSVYTQNYRPYEIVVVDNASGDGTPQLISSRWPEIRLIRLHHNIGCQPARNIGMANCRGTYIFNLDDDGWLHPHTLERTAERFEQEPELFLINTRVIIPNGIKRGWNEPISGDRERYVANFSGCACALRREMLPQVGFFPEYPRGHAEADLALRALDAGKRLLYLPSAKVFHQPSSVERNPSVLRYWLTRHRLETSLRLSPFPYLLAEIPWKLAIEFKSACRDRSRRGFFRGLAAFCWDLPHLLSRRKPVSRKSIRLRDYLTYTLVTGQGELDLKVASSFSLPELLKNKFRQRKQ